MAYGWLSDEQLERRVEELRSAAHNAPFAEWSKDHKGHSAIVNHTTVYAKRGNEWIEASNELARRRRA